MRPKRRDGHEGWTRSYAAAWDRVFAEAEDPPAISPDAPPPVTYTPEDFWRPRKPVPDLMAALEESLRPRDEPVKLTPRQHPRDQS